MSWPAAVARYLRAYISWRTSRQEAVSHAKQPSLEVVTATELALNPGPLPTDGIDVRVEDVSGGSVRPGGKRFGALVHALLADVPLSDSDMHIVERLAAAHGRMLGADANEIEAANEVVRRVLEHPLLRKAAQAAEQGRCYRETPVTLRLDPGVVIEGNVDLAYDTAGHVTVVDFKTDRELEGALDVYRRQVQIYAYAIAAATGLRASAVLMKV